MTPNFLQKFILQRGIQGWACSGVGGKGWVNLKCHSSAVEVWLSLGSLLRATVLGSLQASPEAAASSMAPRNKHGLWPSSSSLPHLCSSWFCVVPLCEFPFLFPRPLCFCLCLRTRERFSSRHLVTSQVEESAVV